MTVVMGKLTVALVTFLAVAVVHLILKTQARRRKHVSISYIPGPHSPSYMLGNMSQWLQAQAGETDLKWQQEFGNVVRVKGILGTDRLWIADPKALQYVHGTASENFVKPADRREANKFLMGPGVLVAQGADHTRQRKVMAPAFATAESRSYLGIFRETARKLRGTWKENIAKNAQGKATVDICRWLSRATLDALGKAAFDYDFGALTETENELSEAYHDLMTDAYAMTSPGKVFVQQLLGLLPPSAFHILTALPSKGIAHMRRVAQTATAVARDIVVRKRASLDKGEDIGKDVMSLLVKANASEDVKAKLSDEELFAQMRTIMFGGHETTAKALTWSLWELAKHPTVQSKLRAEIRAICTRADGDFTLADMDDMPYCLAVMKEALRYHPPLYAGLKQALRNDVIPISTPIRTNDGRMVTEIPVGPGQDILISICAYNRSKEVWGDDADQFRPERWLESHNLEKSGTPFGIYANLATFSHGPTSCIGYRFAIAEFQTFLVELIDAFKFSLPDDGMKIRRAASGIMAPMVEGQLDKGAQLPLFVELAD